MTRPMHFCFRVYVRNGIVRLPVPFVREAQQNRENALPAKRTMSRCLRTLPEANWEGHRNAHR